MIANTLRTALAVLRRNPFFTGVSLFAICFTLTVLVTVATLLENVSRPGVPSTRPETLVTIERAQMWGEENDWTSNPGYKLLDGVLRDLPGVERLSLFTTSATRLYWNRGEKVELDLKFTDEAFWKVYEFPLLEGRFYDRTEVDAAEPVAVISRSARERIFGTGPTTGPLVLQNRSYRVVGVVEDVPVYNKLPRADIWVPLGNYEVEGWRENWMGRLQAAMRLKDGNSGQAVREEIGRRCSLIDPDPEKEYDHIFAYVDTTPLEAAARELLSWNERGDTSGYLGKLLALLAAATLLFMSLPALNLVNLNLSRMMERSSEIGVRRAFGATAGSLVLQLLVENLLLVAIGGLLALACSWLLLQGIAGSGLLEHAHFRLNGRVFAMALGLVLVFTVLSGLLPAWRTARMHPVEALKGTRR